MEIITREQALLSGSIRYFTGKPCRYGHIEERYTKGSKCSGCSPRKTERRKGIKNIWEDTQRGKDYHKQYSKEWFTNKSEEYKDKCNERTKASRAKARSLQHAGIPERPIVCEVCGNEETAKGPKGIIRFLSLDHDHNTGKFRGWLCGKCNMAIGLAIDNPKLLRDLADYLENHVALQ